MPTQLATVNTSYDQPIVPVTNGGTSPFGGNYTMFTGTNNANGLYLSVCTINVHVEVCGSPEFCPGCLEVAVHAITGPIAAPTNAADLVSNWQSTTQDLLPDRLPTANHHYLRNAFRRVTLHAQGDQLVLPSENEGFQVKRCFVGVLDVKCACLDHIPVAQRERLDYVIMTDQFPDKLGQITLKFEATITNYRE